MNQITILGATGLVGNNLLAKAIGRGYKVKVLVRNSHKLKGLTPQVEVIEGNYFDKGKLKQALEDSVAILSTIGPPLSNGVTATDETNYINSMAYMIEQMEANHQFRLISISGAGIVLPNENLPLARKLMRVMLKTTSRTTVNIKDKELKLLFESGLNWTNIRPPMIKEVVDGAFTVDENKFLGMAVDVNQLTDFMLDEIDNKRWLKKAPIVATK
ncbi:NAD(P)-dependent oxidoreductase [Mangrovibacterium sp.]|uniref:NAD(P)-dependent oxidoreductase n=1 Tax=Mangrovibacterium sp. TaxID=1961364 RepID=UPI00356ADA51